MKQQNTNKTKKERHSMTVTINKSANAETSYNVTFV